MMYFCGKRKSLLSMKKLILSLVALVAMLAACQPNGSQQAAESKKTTVSEQLSATEVQNRVRDIYKTVFKVYNEEDSLRNLDIQMENGVFANLGQFNKDFCSKEWNRLLAKINEIDSLNHNGELGFWEFDYWIMGQDWHNLSISDIEMLNVAQNEATVQLKLHNFDSAVNVALQLVKEDGSWKIDNFQQADNDMDLKQVMLQYIEEETAKTKK